MSAVLRPVRQLARFQLLRELGRGAQATVWLAHDPRLDRDVAVKLLAADADADTRAEWLNEARAVSRLKHPNVVPVFEADEADGQPYLVFEYVEGPTLYDRRRSEPRLPAREAAQLVAGVLEALAAAHDQHIVHRDLKPSNVLLGHDGRPRVMDFGIAARVRQGDGRIVGTPGYMSPEAARGEPPVPAMDVFSAGAMLGEMLCGQPLLRERDPWRAVSRVQVEDLRLPADAPVDDTLRGIVHRALERDVHARYDSARSMLQALRHWLEPAAAAAPAENSHATLEFLLRRMRHKSDFPALSDSVVRIQQLSMSDTERISALSDAILKDVSLTNKLLRMVNTVHFTSVAGGGISTVSRAVALVGFAGIRNMALSVILLEHMKDKGHAAQMKEEFLRALMAGTLAGELTPAARESEEAFLAAMFQNLGRLLTEYYFQDEATQIRDRLAMVGDAIAPEQREAMSRQVLGMGFNDLGAGVAKAWGLPDTLQRALRLPEGEVPAKAVDRRVDQGVERMRWLASGANAMTDALLGADGDAQAQALALTAQRFAPALGLQVRDMLGCADVARGKLAGLTQALGLHVAPGAPARRLLAATPERGPAASAPVPAAPVEAARSVRGLERGVDSVRQAVAQGTLRLNELLLLVLDTLQRELGAQRAVLCLRDVRGTQLVGRVARGEGAPGIAQAFQVPLGAAAAGDLFGAVCAKGADLQVADARTLQARLPAWWRERVGAGTFVLLPLQLKGAPIGLLYADKAQPGSLQLGDAELALLRALRDETVAAITRGGG